jgi:hypothetical protein
MIVLIKLILSHLIGDFILQPDSWVKAKSKDKFKAYQLYLHSLIHGVIIMLLVWNITFWYWAVALVLFHLFIDGLKIICEGEDSKRTFFFVDQICHVLSILLIWNLYQGNYFIDITILENEKILILLTAILMLTEPAALFIKAFISKWSPTTEDKDNESLEKAGKYIGIIERLFVFVFIIKNQWEAIGFLLAAKSVFRFGDLSNAKDRKLTEYVLIGTLISFGIAGIIGILYVKLG